MNSISKNQHAKNYSNIMLNLNFNNSKDYNLTESSSKKTTVSNDLKLVNKLYEFKNNMIHESCFNSSEIDNIYDFVKDYVENYPNGIILIVSDLVDIKNNLLINIILKYNLKHIIFHAKNSKNGYSDKYENINSMKKSVREAYNMVKDNQSILICGVEQNFDFFSALY